MIMNKKELVGILQSIGIPVNEGLTALINNNVCPRIVYCDDVWEDVVSSGTNYVAKETLQVSVISKIPRDPKLLELRKVLRNKKIYITIRHEYIKDNKVFHSYFSIEVLSDE